MSWKEALKEYADINGNYVIPKKGTKQYDEVKQIQEKMKSASQKTGDGFIKDSFVGVVKKVNKTIDENIEPVENNIPLAEGEIHAKKIVLKNGKVKYQNYNYAGPGTKVKERLSKKVQPIDGIDAAAQQHDIDYTLNFQERIKKGQKVTKKEVQEADKRFVEKVKMNKNDNRVFAATIPPLFKAKQIAEDTGLLNHTSFFDPKTGSGVSKKRNTKTK